MTLVGVSGPTKNLTRLMHRLDNPPEDWAAIVGFMEGPRTTFEEVRKHRPPKERVQKALNDYLERIKFGNCRINQGYLKALGLR